MNFRKEYDTSMDYYRYYCSCGERLYDYEYNYDTGHYECDICDAESPDLDQIEE